ncbi:MAG: recombination mediator RecR [Candidatus Moranbacteria bacterium]|jgi:recombination protein RecR|nr:recombination mediator RecR [Candidatus Moranbacteria bacterium]
MFPKSFQKLIDHFASLPSVGPKMAERLVLYLWKQDQEKLDDLSETLKDLKTKISFCKRCFNISENDLCAICQDKKRDTSIICVVEDPLDVISIEKTRQMRGLYHVLGGTINAPADKKNPLKIKELLARLKKEKIAEVIIATNPTTEGEATALYLARFTKPLNIKTTRLARGLPTGGDIEYADEVTLRGAIEGRKEI